MKLYCFSSFISLLDQNSGPKHPKPLVCTVCTHSHENCTVHYLDKTSVYSVNSVQLEMLDNAGLNILAKRGYWSVEHSPLWEFFFLNG